jgi:hypothetical protein
VLPLFGKASTSANADQHSAKIAARQQLKRALPYSQIIRRLQIGELMPAGDRKRLEERLKGYLTRLNQILEISLEGDLQKAKRLINRTLYSFDGRLAAVTAVAVDGRYEGVSPYDFRFEQLAGLANQLNCSKPLSGHLRLFTKLKENGKKRVIANPSGNVRAAGRLVADCLLAHRAKSAIDFTFTGSGRTAAALAIKEAIQDGYTTWIVFDIANFYPSIKPKHLRGLPLPCQVIPNVLLANGYLPIKSDTGDLFSEAVRLGLPMGATPSPIVASGLIERVLRPHIGEEHRVVAYADDVAIAARAPGGIPSVAKAIQHALETHHAGPLQLKHFGMFDSNHGFEMLGYRFIGSQKDGCEIGLSGGSFKRFYLRLYEKLDEADTTDFDTKQAICNDYQENWLASHAPVSPSTIRENAELLVIDVLNHHGKVSAVPPRPLFESSIGKHLALQI